MCRHIHVRVTHMHCIDMIFPILCGFAMVNILPF